MILVNKLQRTGENYIRGQSLFDIFNSTFLVIQTDGRTDIIKSILIKTRTYRTYCKDTEILFFYLVYNMSAIICDIIKYEI